MRIRHKGLRALHERDDPARLPLGLAPPLRHILFRLQEATHPGSADAPSFRLRPLTELPSLGSSLEIPLTTDHLHNSLPTVASGLFGDRPCACRCRSRRRVVILKLVNWIRHRRMGIALVAICLLLLFNLLVNLQMRHPETSRFQLDRIPYSLGRLFE